MSTRYRSTTSYEIQWPTDLVYALTREDSQWMKEFWSLME